MKHQGLGLVLRVIVAVFCLQVFGFPTKNNQQLENLFSVGVILFVLCFKSLLLLADTVYSVIELSE